MVLNMKANIWIALHFGCIRMRGFVAYLFFLNKKMVQLSNGIMMI